MTAPQFRRYLDRAAGLEEISRSSTSVRYGGFHVLVWKDNTPTYRTGAKVQSQGTTAVFDFEEAASIDVFSSFGLEIL